jgi:hypothetical protein
MRTLLLLLFTASMLLVSVGATVPELFAVSLLGMALLTGTGVLALATMQHPGPRPHY